MELPELVPIEYQGELVALVSAERVHIISPQLATRPSGDPDLRFVAYMCLCCGEILRGQLAGPYTQELGELWARHALTIGERADKSPIISDSRSGPGDQCDRRPRPPGL